MRDEQRVPELVGDARARALFGEHARLQRYALSFVPAERRAGAHETWSAVEERLGHWVRGQLILMAVLAVATGVVYSVVGLPSALLLGLFAGLAEVIVEYALGFAFGWTIFQALFMRDMAGGSYPRALTSTFVAELLSMNLLMAGMVPTVMALKTRIPSAADPMTPSFWFVMSMGLLVGFIIAYPMNWWLVAYHLKHGMMTVRPVGVTAGRHGGDTPAGMSGAPQAGPAMPMSHGEAPRPPVPVMALLSFAALAAGVAIALLSRAR